ncbi:MAG: hypothetical protein AAGA25_07175 [Planctomycetota bacterium]
MKSISPPNPPATASLRPLPGKHVSWRFSVQCPKAEQVMLVTEDDAGLSSWVPMNAAQDGLGTWELDIPENGVMGPVRYYTIEEGSVLNCGTAGLSATRVPRYPNASSDKLAATA